MLQFILGCRASDAHLHFYLNDQTQSLAGSFSAFS